jgi:hypothetical protein
LRGFEGRGFGTTSIRFPFASVISTFCSHSRAAFSPSMANMASKSSPNRADSISQITHTIFALCKPCFARAPANARFSSAVKYRGPALRWSLASFNSQFDIVLLQLLLLCHSPRLSAFLCKGFGYL